MCFEESIGEITLQLEQYQVLLVVVGMQLLMEDEANVTMDFHRLHVNADAHSLFV